MEGDGDLPVNAGDLGALDCLNIARQLALVSDMATFPVPFTYVFDNHRK